MAIANPNLIKATLVPNDLVEVAYTDSWREDVPGVPYYVSAGTDKSTFWQAGTTVGSDITLNDSTWSLTGGDFVYSLQATVFCTVPGATFQWYQLSNESYMWEPTLCGLTSTFTWTPADDEDIVLRVQAPNGTEFQYPAQVTAGSVLIQQIAGYEVA